MKELCAGIGVLLIFVAGYVLAGGDRMRAMESSGYSRAAVVTPSDANLLAPGFTAKAIYVGGAGTLKVDLSRGGTVTFTAVQVGWIHNIQVNRVYSTGTTATAIVVLGD